MYNNSYLNNEKVIYRLLQEYKKYKNLIIGFDFDSTIYDYNKENLDLQPVIDLIKRASDLGLTMCLHSLCTKKEDIKIKTDFVKNLGINVHYFNTSPILINSFPEDHKKPFYSILLDDRAGLSSAYSALNVVLEEIERLYFPIFYC
jgi:hypothetical protein